VVDMYLGVPCCMHLLSTLDRPGEDKGRILRTSCVGLVSRSAGKRVGGAVTHLAEGLPIISSSWTWNEAVSYLPIPYRGHEVNKQSGSIYTTVRRIHRDEYGRRQIPSALRVWPVFLEA